MTLYVVTQGEYSDYHIVGIYSDRETAEKIRKYKSVMDDMCDIEEYELNPNLPEDIDEVKEYCLVGYSRPVYEMYRINPLSSEGIKWHVLTDFYMAYDNKPDIEYEFAKDYSWGSVCILKSITKDREHAIKIAQDIRAKVIAEQEGL